MERGPRDVLPVLRRHQEKVAEASPADQARRAADREELPLHRVRKAVGVKADP